MAQTTLSPPSRAYAPSGASTVDAEWEGTDQFGRGPQVALAPVAERIAARRVTSAGV